MTKKLEIHAGEKDMFSKWCWSNWTSICRRLQINPYYDCAQNSTPNRSMDLNIRPEMMNLMKERVGNRLEVVDIGEEFSE